MRDSFNREIDYLRISVTDRCNMRCVYCMPGEGVEWKTHAEILTFEEMIALCRIFAELGIKKIKVSGGEPLVRRGLPGFVEALKTTPGVEQVTLTTNGLLLNDHLDALLDAGLDAVNISLDTLNPVTFGKITRYPYSVEYGGLEGKTAVVRNKALEQILTALDKALARALRVKINCVPIEGLNDADIVPLAALARDRPLAVRFIELMPLGRAASFTGIPAAALVSILTGGIQDAGGVLMPDTERIGNGPAVYYRVKGWQGRIGLIAALSHSFCATCNRLRLSASGMLSPCLSSSAGTDLRVLLRGGKPLAQTIAAVIGSKPASHNFLECRREKAGHSDKAMWNIGG